MSDYDADKDVLVTALGSNHDMTLFAEIRSYDGGAEKLCVKRLVGKKGRTVQIVRLARPDAKALGEFLVKLTSEDVAEEKA